MMKYTEPIRLCNNEVHSMILQKIKKGSRVLEFGAACGRMTKLLQQEYGCTVYIVEQELEAYQSAMQYAVEGLCGDIEAYAWKKWRFEPFDLILFCDVLEHLRNPRQVLAETKELLKEGGSVFVSLPNIGHNDIFVKLYEQRFEYTKEGLLDDTHIRFFAENSLESFVNGTGYVIVTKQYKTVATGMTEQYHNEKLFCTDELLRILRKRKNGDVYQFVLELKKETHPECTYDKIYEEEHRLPVYGLLYFDRGKGFSQKDVTEIAGKWVQKEIYDFQAKIFLDENVTRIRFDPVERQPCRIISSKCSPWKESIPNEIFYNDTEIIMDEDPKMIWDVPKEERQWFFQIRIDMDVDDILKGLMSHCRDMETVLIQRKQAFENAIVQWEQKGKEYEQKIFVLEQKNRENAETITMLKQKNLEDAEYILSLKEKSAQDAGRLVLKEKELYSLLHSKSWKYTAFLRKTNAWITKICKKS